AMDRNRAIGRGNDLPWRLPDDLRRFKALTLGTPLLMGRRTDGWLGRALPGRSNLVLPRSGAVPFEGMQPVGSLEQALGLARAQGAGTLSVIGGGEVYALALPLATDLHLTLVDTAVEDADTFFPEWDPAQWQELTREAHPADARHAHAFDSVDYRRRCADRLIPCAGAAESPARRGPGPAARAARRHPGAGRAACGPAPRRCRPLARCGRWSGPGWTSGRTRSSGRAGRGPAPRTTGRGRAPGCRAGPSRRWRCARAACSSGRG